MCVEKLSLDRGGEDTSGQGSYVIILEARDEHPRRPLCLLFSHISNQSCLIMVFPVLRRYEDPEGAFSEGEGGIG